MSQLDVKWCSKRKAIVSNNKLLKGITKISKTAFYPHYSFNSLIKTKVNIPPSTKVKGSIRTGNGLDRVISDTVRLQLQYNLNYNVFWCSKAASKASKLIRLKSHQSSLLKFNKRHNNYCQKFWKLMTKLQLKPIATQVPVRHSVLQIGTLIDLICIDSNGLTRVIEIKSGQETYTDAGTLKPMLSPFESQSTSAHNQAQIQVSLGHEMYRMTNKTTAMGQPIVLRFHSLGVEISDREDWIDKQNIIDEAFKQIEKRAL